MFSASAQPHPFGRRSAVALLLLAMQCRPALAVEETLADVLASVRALHPRAAAAEALARAMAEGVPQARAGWFPKVTATADAGVLTDPAAPTLSPSGSTHPAGFGVTIGQTVFDSGRTSSAVGGAVANAKAQRESAHLADQQLLLETVTTYVDVRHGRRLIELTQATRDLLAATREATRRRVDARDATTADLAQTVAALAGAEARLAALGANLAASEAAFATTLQHVPGALASPPSVDRHLPSSQTAAMSEADRASPTVIIALHRQAAARHAADRARAELLPSIGIEASVQRRYGTPVVPDQPDGLAVRAVATMPLLTGGAGTAAVRQADFNHAAARYQVADTRLQARAAVAQAWSRLVGARATRAAFRAQLQASRSAVLAVTAEQKVGQRTILELITAQQAVLAAGTSLAESERDVVLASYGLLAQLGRLDPASLARPEVHTGLWRTTVAPELTRPEAWTIVRK